MNLAFHAGAGAILGALVLGPEAAPADLALCAVAGTMPDWDGALFLFDRDLYGRVHRTATHGLLGVLLGALAAAAALSLWGGWAFPRAAGLWWLGAMSHAVSDLFNRQGVALLYPFSSERVRFPAVSWGSPLLTAGALLAALVAFLLPEAGRWVSLAAVVGYVVYLCVRLRRPLLQDFVSDWWFSRICGAQARPALREFPGDTPGFRERTR